MTPEERKHWEEFGKGADAALLRASKRAREIARQTRTPFVYIDEHGNLVNEIPPLDGDSEPNAEG